MAIGAPPLDETRVASPRSRRHAHAHHANDIVTATSRGKGVSSPIRRRVVIPAHVAVRRQPSRSVDARLRPILQTGPEVVELGAEKPFEPAPHHSGTGAAIRLTAGLSMWAVLL